MTEIVDHKRKNYDNYFHGTAASAAMTTATAAAAAATNYGSMSGKKLKTDAGGGPIYPKVWLAFDLSVRITTKSNYTL